MEEPDEEWENDPLSVKENDKVSWILRKGLGLGKKIVISGVVIISAPFIVPPLLVFSAFGLAFSVPFGVYFVSYACTKKIMSKLLSTPMLPPDVPEYDVVLLDDVEISCGGDAEEDMGFGEVIDFENEEERLRNDVEKAVEMRIELPDKGNEGFDQEGKLMEVEYVELGGVDSEEHESMKDDVNKVVNDEGCEEDDEDLNKENVKPLREIDMKSGGGIEEKTVGHELADEGNEAFDHEWKPTEVESYKQGDVDGKEHEPIKDEGYEKDDEGVVKDKSISVQENDMKMEGDREYEIVKEEENVAKEQVMSMGEIDMEMKGKIEEEANREEGYKKDEELADEQVLSLEEIEMKLGGGNRENGNKIVIEGDDENSVVEIGKPLGVSGENMGAEKSIDIEGADLVVSETLSMNESIRDEDCIGTAAEVDKHQVREITGAPMESHKRYAVNFEKRDKPSRIRKKYRTNKMEGAIKKKEDEVSKKLLETTEMNERNFNSVPNIVEVDILPERRETAYVHTTVNEVNERFDHEWKRTEVENYQQGGVDGKDREPMKDSVNGTTKEERYEEDNQNLGKGQVKALVEIDMKIEEENLGIVEEESKDQKSINGDIEDAMEVDDENITRVEVGEPFEMTRSINEDTLEVKTDESNGNNVEAVTFSNADARDTVDESELNLGDNKNTVNEHYNSVKEANEGTEQLPSYVDENIAAEEVPEALTVSAEVPESPSEKSATALSDKAFYSEEKIWENIRALRTIVGYKVARQQTCMEELKAIYIFTGVEPPISSKDSSDLGELNDKLRFLMTIVGVK